MLQTIAMLYLSKGSGFSDGRAFLTVAGLNAVLYLTPVSGEMLANKIMCCQRAIMICGALLAVGYMTMMAIPAEWSFFLGAAIAASSCFKPRMSLRLSVTYVNKMIRAEMAVLRYFTWVLMWAPYCLLCLLTGWSYITDSILDFWW